MGDALLVVDHKTGEVFPAHLLFLDDETRALRDAHAGALRFGRRLRRSPWGRLLPRFVRACVVMAVFLARSFVASRRFVATHDTTDLPLGPSCKLIERQQLEWKWHALKCPGCIAMLEEYERMKRGEPSTARTVATGYPPAEVRRFVLAEYAGEHDEKEP